MIIHLIYYSQSKDIDREAKRETISSPWVTEDGQPLPYIGQFESVENNPNTLHIAVKPDGKWVKERPDWVFVFAVCEIET